MDLNNIIDFYRDVLYDFFLDTYEGENEEADFEEWVNDLSYEELVEITGEG